MVLRKRSCRWSCPRFPPVWKRRPGDRIFRVARVRPWLIPLPAIPRPRHAGLSPVILIYGFAGVIVLGMILLVLPVSSKAGGFTSPVNALFTSASAVCVTGLAVVDTGTYWSGFGQGVILVLIQIGGLGFMASATLLLLLLGRRLGIRERWLIGQSFGLERMGGMVKLVRRILIFTFVVEAIGALIFYIRFSVENPAGTAAWRAVFQCRISFQQLRAGHLRQLPKLAELSDGYDGDTDDRSAHYSRRHQLHGCSGCDQRTALWQAFARQQDSAGHYSGAAGAGDCSHF